MSVIRKTDLRDKVWGRWTLLERVERFGSNTLRDQGSFYLIEEINTKKSSES